MFLFQKGKETPFRKSFLLNVPLSKRRELSRDTTSKVGLRCQKKKGIMSVTELLNNLIELQSVDIAILDFKKQLSEDIPAQLKACDSDIEAAKSDLKQAEEGLKELQLKRKTKEMDLDTKEGAIKKYQGQLYQVKTNAEYAALEKEIGGLKADNSVLEEEILAIFDNIEAAEKGLAEAKNRFEDEKKQVDGKKNNIALEKKEIEKKLVELEEKRKAIIPLVDKETLSRYERILHGKGGVALVPVVGENCGGCFVDLPPQVINEIRAKGKIIYCERCARMIYIEN